MLRERVDSVEGTVEVVVIGRVAVLEELSVEVVVDAAVGEYSRLDCVLFAIRGLDLVAARAAVVDAEGELTAVITFFLFAILLIRGLEDSV